MRCARADKSDPEVEMLRRLSRCRAPRQSFPHLVPRTTQPTFLLRLRGSAGDGPVDSRAGSILHNSTPDLQRLLRARSVFSRPALRRVRGCMCVWDSRLLFRQIARAVGPTLFHPRALALKFVAPDLRRSLRATSRNALSFV